MKVHLFDHDLQERIREVNHEFIEQAEARAAAVRDGSPKQTSLSEFEGAQRGAGLEDLECDCRRVLIQVHHAETQRQVATINYGFEPSEPPYEDEPQVFLDPINPQSQYSDRLKDAFVMLMLTDRDYVARLHRHYDMWKRVVDDLRAPYLGWLAGVDRGADDAAREPSVPPGLDSLDGPLRALADLLGIDDSLIAAAAEASPRQTFNMKAARHWLSEQSAATKDRLLLRAMEKPSHSVGAELLSDFRKAEGPPPRRPRTVAQLRDRAAALA